MTTVAKIAGGLRQKRAGQQWLGACPCCGYRQGLSLKNGDGTIAGTAREALPTRQLRR